MRVYSRKNLKFKGPTPEQGRSYGLFDYWRSIHSSHYPLRIKGPRPQLCEYYDKKTYEELVEESKPQTVVYKSGWQHQLPERKIWEIHPVKRLTKEQFEKLRDERNFQEQLDGLLK